MPLMRHSAATNDCREHGDVAHPSVILVALGANLPSSAGDPAETLRVALGIMHGSGRIAIRALTNFWRTRAYPPASGPDYCNAVAAISTDLDPPGLLALLHDIEARLGRRRTGERWQSRPLDLDLIAWDDLVLPDGGTQDHWRRLPPDRQAAAAPGMLILPHPRMQDRGFVLAPLAEIAPGWRHPRTGQTVSAMLAALDQQEVESMHVMANANLAATS